ncbi:hypothetical protein [Mycetocola zhadangensis]|uniref:hypothetical protein n=1 Tax=Mycetocola zhadangensis TaxID=1164595 RepID=UPI001600564D|nr:hypothetical protein [Mycetocola zhadangensis]GGF04105.1 hypothetical protein GCM10011313_28990 [Mycetocola zhadangensis]
MDITWLLVVGFLVVVFASISAIGALRRIADATEKTAADVAELLTAARKSDLQP